MLLRPKGPESPERLTFVGSACSSARYSVRIGRETRQSKSRLFRERLGLMLQPFLNPSADLAAHVENAGIGDCVKECRASPKPCQKPHLRQGLEMTRDIGLLQATGLHQLADALFPGLQRDKQFQPVGFAADMDAIVAEMAPAADPASWPARESS